MLVRNLEELGDFAKKIAEQLKPGDVLLLEGDLGSGKTAFVKLLAKSLGFMGEVTSPSFTVVNEYELGGRKIAKLIHVDLYRLDDVKNEGVVKDVIERVDEEGRLTVIEWAEKLVESEFENIWRMRFDHTETEAERLITVSSCPDGRK